MRIELTVVGLLTALLLAACPEDKKPIELDLGTLGDISRDRGQVEDDQQDGPTPCEDHDDCDDDELCDDDECVDRDDVLSSCDDENDCPSGFVCVDEECELD